MARSLLFKKVRRILRLAHLANRKKLSAGHVADLTASVCQEPLLSRRDFVKYSTVWGGMAALGKTIAFPMPRPTGNQEKVTIIGAGIAGLTTAYRLAQNGIPCEIYEASARLGGRLFTKQQFNSEGMFVELGAELVDTDNQDLISLCTELGLALEDFSSEGAGLVDSFFYAQGRIYTETQAIEAFRPLAKRLSDDIEKIVDLDSQAAKELDRTPLRDYLSSFEGEVDSWILDILGNVYVGEYGRDTIEQSTINLLSLIDPDTQNGLHLFGRSDESKRIKGGSSALPDALAAAISSKVPVHLGYRLEAIEDTGSQFKLSFGTAGGSRLLSTNQIVFALPFSTLRLVRGIFSLSLDPKKKQSIARLGYGTNSKLMLGFQERFWRTQNQDTPASKGEIFSDLTYSQEFWETSRLQNGTLGILTNYLGGEVGEKPPRDLLDITLSQLARLYPRAPDLFDGNQVLKVWAASPYHLGSYSCPLVGQCTTFLGIEGQPELGGRLLFAGEHCSKDYQGYMNGAIESANQAAQIIVGKPHHLKGSLSTFARI